MESESGILSESLFFTKRKAPVHSHIEKSTDVASTSSRYYSARIDTLTKLKSERGMSEQDAEIEASKSHWTEMESESSTSGESCGVGMTAEETAELYKENVEEMRLLQQMENGDDYFFQIGGKVLGKMIAKGGQATIYEAWWDIGDRMISTVWKVFAAGLPVREFRKLWTDDLQRSGMKGSKMTLEKVRNTIFCGKLLDDGRFAFEMFKYWGDVRKLLDVRMQHNGNRYPPFMMEDGSYEELCIRLLWILIAKGMKGLHDEGTLHRDLKASNVLIDTFAFFESYKEEDRLNPLEMDLELKCVIADYECPIGVVGTRFWRAPEILKALKDRTLDNAPSVFTPKMDVYSYAMTCYEILTGFVPFEHPEDEGTNIDHVLEGKRPTLPQHLKPWVVNLFHKCWHPNPLVRPSFTKIVEFLVDNRNK